MVKPETTHGYNGKKSARKSRLAAHASNLNMLLLVLVLALMTIISAAIINDINSENAKNLVRVYSIEASQMFYSYISQDLTLVRKAAHSKALTSWFADEEDEAKRDAAFYEMMDFEEILSGVHLYFGIHESGNEYTIKGIVELEDYHPFAQLDPSKATDAWYFESIESENEYSIRIDVEKLTHTWRLWINHKVITDGELSGLFCSGLQIPDVFEKIFGNYDAGKVRGYVIDKHGVIQSDSTAYDIYEESSKHIREEKTAPAFAAALASYLGRIDGIFDENSQPEIVRLSSRSGKQSLPYEYAAIEPIGHTDWSVVVFYNGHTLSAVSNLLPLILVMLAALFLYVIGRNTLMKRLIFAPLDHLTQSVSEGKSTDLDFFGSDRDDEIGELARTIRDATHEQQRQEQLLHAVNSAAAVLLAAEDDENVQAALLEGMEIIGRSVNVDRIHIWQNETIDGVFCYVNKARWRGEAGQQQASAAVKRAYSEVPEWERKFLLNEYVNGPLSGRTKEEQDILIPQGVKSILAIPLFLQNHFWGYFSFDDCHRERTFTEEEIEILRSAGLMIVSVINRAEQAAQIRKANEHSKLMLDATPLSCRIWDKNYRILDCNEEAVKLFGLSSKQEYFDRFFDLSPKYQPDGTLSSEATVPNINKALSIGRFDFEWMHQDLNGTPIPTEITLVRVPYEDDYIVAGYTRDLREQKRMTDEIERRDKLLQVVNRAATVMLASEDEDDIEVSLQSGMELMGRCVDVDRVQIWRNVFIDGNLHFILKYQWLSEAGRQTTRVPLNMQFPYSILPKWEEKFSRGEYINEPFSGLSAEEQDVLNAYDIKSIVLIPLFLQNQLWGFFSLDDCIKERTFTEDEVNILRSGSLMMVSAINRSDQAQNTRAASNKMEAIIANYSGIIWSVGEDNVITTFNGRYLNELGISSELFEGRKLNDALHDRRFFSIRDSVRKTYAEGPQDLISEMDDKTYRTRATPIYNGSGSIASVMGSFDDITERTRLQAELKAALEEARNASNAKSSFLASMSHEMRTPLNAIIGLSELTMEDAGLGEEAQTNLEKINSAGATLLSTVNDILDISKIEAGRFELVPVEYDMPSLINDAITQSIMRIGDKPIHFVLDIDKNVPSRLYGDDLRLKQILNNLLSNAFKYTKEGTVTLGLSCERLGEEVMMTARVSDTGAGIKSEDIERLFSDYTKIDTKSNRKIEGTGLGLPITKNIAEMMGGSIAVESEYGKGSVFTVKVLQQFINDDVIGPEVVNSLKTFHYSDHKRRSFSKMTRINLPYARVLVVDDVATNLDVARGMLKPYGMQVDCVNSGQEAVDAIRSEEPRYNAVFMDHMMPEMDGIEAARIIREEIGTEYAKTIPIIALTANAIVGNEAMFLSKGFQAFISKPIEIDRLDIVIRDWVRDKEKEKDLKQVDQKSSGKERRTLNKEISGLDMGKGIDNFTGDEESYLQILNSFAVNTRPLLEKAREVNFDKLSDYAITVHGIKGSGRSICAGTVGDMAEALENAAKDGDINFVRANNPAFIRVTEKLIGDLEELLGNLATENPKPKKDKPDREALSKLLNACEKYDMDGVDEAMAEIESCEYESDDGLAAWLRENVNHMNFRQIKEKLTGSFGGNH